MSDLFGKGKSLTTDAILKTKGQEDDLLTPSPWSPPDPLSASEEEAPLPSPPQPKTHVDIGKIHAAAKIIEMDGEDGIQTAIGFVGKDIAIALLVAFLRRGHGSTDTFPPRPEIDEKVNATLRTKKLI